MKSAATYIFIGTLRDLALRQFEVFSSFFWGANFRLIVVASFSCLAPALFVDSILYCYCCSCGFCCCTGPGQGLRRGKQLLTLSHHSFQFRFSTLQEKGKERLLTSYKTRCCLLFILVAAFSAFSPFSLLHSLLSAFSICWKQVEITYTFDFIC